MSLVNLIAADEGFRAHVYDDATGAPIIPGSVVKGHPTIGYGLALDVDGLSPGEALQLLTARLSVVQTALKRREWYLSLSPVRQDAIAAMAYQLGVSGVDSFTSMIAALVANRWGDAAAAMLNSRWASQTPKRAAKTARMIATGSYP